LELFVSNNEQDLVRLSKLSSTLDILMSSHIIPHHEKITQMLNEINVDEEF